MPVDARRFIRKMRGGAQAHLLEASDGRFYVAGASNGNFAIARFTRDGALDSGFDVDGKQTTDMGGSNDVINAIQTAKRVLVPPSTTNPPQFS